MVSRAERGPVADWFWTIDRFFLATFILLMGVGFMLSFAASPAVAERIGLDSFHFVKRHARVPAAVAGGDGRPISSCRRARCAARRSILLGRVALA